jgi:hypothetical protein
MKKRADFEEMRSLLANWVDQGHQGVEQFRGLAGKALKSGKNDVASNLCAAVLAIEVATDFLRASLDNLGPGGPV